MAGSSERVEAAEARELLITRTFDAPRALVWEAWTNPAHIKEWLGPEDCSKGACEAELRVGGRFRLEIGTLDGKTHFCAGTYREIVEPERIVYAGEMEGEPCGAGIPPRSLVTVTFSEKNGRTTVQLHVLFETMERKRAAVAGRFSVSWREALTRLGQWSEAEWRARRRECPSEPQSLL